MWKKVAAAVIAVIGVVFIAFQVFGDRLVRHAMLNQIEANLSGKTLAELDDGLHVILCGSGSPLPDPTRAGPCAMVIAGDTVIVVDVGSGSMRNLGPMGIPGGAIDALFLTHFHSDHVDGLGELMLQRWAGAGYTTPLPIHGPPGVDVLVAGFNQAYSQDDSYRVGHHGADIMPPSGAGGTPVTFAMPDAAGLTMWDAEGLVVTAFPVDHHPVEPSVGYRFDYKGRSAVISGDTKASPVVEQFSEGVDLLVHEALHPELTATITQAARNAGNERVAVISIDILNYHTSPIEAAEIAERAGAQYLLFTHIVPPLPFARLEPMFVEGVDDVYDGDFAVGRDGTLISLPAGSETIQSRSLL